MAAPEIRDNRPTGLLQAYVDGQPAGHIVYFTLDATPAALVAVHTVVGPEYEGQGVEADLHTGGECATEELAVRADRVDVGGGAEVDDDDRASLPAGPTAEQLVRGQRGHDAVGADFPWVVHVQGHPRADAGADEHDRHREGVQQLAQGGQQRRHRGAGGDAGDLGVVQQPAPQQAQLVGSRPRGGGHPPGADASRSVEGGEDGLAVADVDREQCHRSTRSPRR